MRGSAVSQLFQAYLPIRFPWTETDSDNHSDLHAWTRCALSATSEIDYEPDWFGTMGCPCHPVSSDPLNCMHGWLIWVPVSVWHVKYRCHDWNQIQAWCDFWGLHRSSSEMAVHCPGLFHLRVPHHLLRMQRRSDLEKVSAASDHFLSISDLPGVQ